MIEIGTPNIEGIWEWFEEDGTKRLVSVCNVGIPKKYVHLRVAWWGGYYNVHDEHDLENPKLDIYMKAEWPNRWGKYVGRLGSLPDEQLYQMPTTEQRDKIMAAQ